MQNIYDNSMERMKQEHTKNYDYDDDNDDDDYENTTPSNSAPVVPSRDNRKMKDAVKNDLALKCMDIHIKEPPSVWTTPQKGIPLQEIPRYQPPPIGLDFSSEAVNAAFADVADVRSSSCTVNKAFQHLEGIPDDEKKKKPGRCTQVFLVVVLLIVIILVALTGLIFLRYFTIAEELTGLKYSVSDFQKTAKEEQGSLETEVNDLNIAMGKFQDSAMAEIKHINKTLETICKGCPNGWTMIGSACYFLSGDQLTWEIARDECYKISSVLLIIKDKKEMDSLKYLFTSNKRYWIGLRRDPKEIHIWKWLDGTQMSFSNWGVNEPNYHASREHCGETMSGPWNDRSCNDNLFYICKRIRSC